MRTDKTNVVDLLADEKQWSEELMLLRDIILSVGGLKEEIKWGSPIYTVDGKKCTGYRWV